MSVTLKEKDQRVTERKIKHLFDQFNFLICNETFSSMLSIYNNTPKNIFAK